MEPGCPHGSERHLGKDSPFVPSQLRNQHSQPVARERHPVPSPAGTLGRAGGMGNPAAQLVLCTIKSGREQVYLCSVFFFPISQAKLALFLGAVGFVLFSSPPRPVLRPCIYPDSSIRTGSGCKSCNKCLSPQHSGCHDSYSTPFRFYGLIFRLKR